MLHILAALALIVQQTAPASADLTRMLNGTPPTATAPRPTAVAPTTAPVAPVAPATQPAPRPATTATAPSAIAPTTTTPSTTTSVAPTAAAAPPRAVTTSGPSATTRPAPSGAAATDAPTTDEAASEAIEPPPPAPVVLDARAVAALPFTISLPTGFTITTGRPGPDFNVYTIRRGSQPFVMIYTGSASQFPIYSGERVEAGGRSSIVTNEDGHRVALEHLFTRSTFPTEIHIWITSLDGADRLLAEQIGQSVDAR